MPATTDTGRHLTLVQRHGWPEVACDVTGCGWRTVRPDKPGYASSALQAHYIDAHLDLYRQRRQGTS